MIKDKILYGQAANERHLYTEFIGEDGKGIIVPNVDIRSTKDKSGALPTMSLEHHKIHIGKHFFYYKSVGIAGQGVYQFIHNTNCCRPHIFYNIDFTDAPILFEAWEGIEGFTGGTNIPLINNNRNSDIVSSSIVTENPTSVTIGSALKYIDFRIGGVTQGGGRGASTRDENERVLKDSTLYLIRITNLTNQINWINTRFNMYEVTNGNNVEF